MNGLDYNNKHIVGLTSHNDGGGKSISYLAGLTMSRENQDGWQGPILNIMKYFRTYF